MKTKTTFFLSSAIIALMILFTACSPEGQVYKDFQSTGLDSEWPNTKVPTFSFEITEPAQSYDVLLGVRYAKGFPYTQLKVNVRMKIPSGMVKDIPVEVQIRDKAGEYLGDVMGDVGDIEMNIQTGKVFLEKGKYEYTVTSMMPVEPVPMILEIGLIVKKGE
ncbi:MAG: hypothetical protein V2A54_10450 [Bacteroidota bacterium]